MFHLVKDRSRSQSPPPENSDKHVNSGAKKVHDDNHCVTKIQKSISSKLNNFSEERKIKDRNIQIMPKTPMMNKMEFKVPQGSSDSYDRSRELSSEETLRFAPALPLRDNYSLTRAASPGQTLCPNVLAQARQKECEWVSISSTIRVKYLSGLGLWVNVGDEKFVIELDSSLRAVKSIEKQLSLLEKTPVTEQDLSTLRASGIFGASNAKFVEFVEPPKQVQEKNLRSFCRNGDGRYGESGFSESKESEAAPDSEQNVQRSEDDQSRHRIRSAPLYPFNHILPKDFYNQVPHLTDDEKIEQKNLLEKYVTDGLPIENPIKQSYLISVSQYSIDPTFSVVSSRDASFRIETRGLGPCVAVLLVGKEDPHKAAMVHCDVRTDPCVLDEMAEHFTSGATIHMFGGTPSQGSVETQRKVLKKASEIQADQPDSFDVGNCWLGKGVDERGMTFGYDTKTQEFWMRK